MASRWRSGVAGLLLVLVPATAVVAGAEPATHTVRIEGMSFVPETLAMRTGDRVVWVNGDFVPHTATATGGTFDSGSIAPEGSWTYEARQPGNYPYFCALHTTMSGRIVVR